MGTGAGRLADFEQRVGVQRIADERLDFQIGQREQLDRLLQLRRHHQRLRLARSEARPQRHDPLCAPAGITA
jgi:hypothetical protein